LAKRQADNPAILWQRIFALINSGEIHRSLRDSDKAEKLLLQAAELIESELAQSTDVANLNSQAASTYWNLGVLYKDTFRSKEALEFFQKNIAALEKFLELFPGNPDLVIRRANSITNECILLRQFGKPEEVLARYEAAIRSIRGALKVVPQSTWAADELAMTLHDYSMHLRNIGRRDESQLAFDESFSLRQKAYQNNPNATHLRGFLARMYVSQGYFDRGDKKHDSSIEQFGKAAELVQPSVDEFPDLYEHQRDLLAALEEQLTSCLLSNNAIIGKSVWQSFASRLQTALQKFPKDRWVVQKAASWLHAWADHTWEDGDERQSTHMMKSAIVASTLFPSVTTPVSPKQETINCNDLAWKLIVVPDLTQRSLAKGLELARRAVELSPKSSECVHSLCTGLYYSGDYAAAREQLLIAIQLEQPVAQRGSIPQLFEALMALPQDESAARLELESTLGLKKLKPHSMSLYFSMLAMSLWKLDEHQAARNVLRLVVDPPNGFTKDGPEMRRLIREARELIKPE
jgi:tetratricopeptide (TPR) repeat protein